MQFFYKEQKVRNGYITAFGLLMISYLMVFVTIHQMEKRAGLVDHANEIISNLDILLTCIKDSETSYRGYVIMQDTPALTNYGFHTLCINSSFDTLKTLFAGDPEQNLNIDSLYSLVILNRNLISLTMEEIQKGSQPEKNILYERIERGREFIMEIRTLVFKMQTHEKERLVKRTNEFESISRTLKIIHFSTFILALMLVTYSMIVFNNVSIAKRQYRVQLEEGIEKMKIVNADLINLRSIEKFAASGRIARAIAHEVRNPLTSISLAAEQLGPVIKTEEEITLLEIITRNVNRIHDLVAELLNSTKFSLLELSKMSLNTLVDQALELAKDRIELNAIKVIKNFSPNPCNIEVDPEKMKIAILNLLINAIEAMESGKGILDITTLRKKEKCIAMIKDNGTGMGENELSRIFEPYFTQKEQGNGLGLTLTQNIILNHKGNISVESKPDRGTTFTITLNNVE